MVWQPEFEPAPLSRPYASADMRREQHIKFVVGVVSDKGLPDVEFLIPPQVFEQSFQHASNPQAVRSGWAIEHGGQELDRIVIRGRSAAFVVQSVGLASACDGTYIQQCSKARNVIDNLVRIFKDNGSVRNASHNFVIDRVGYSWIMYDDVLYIGRFDTMEVTESGENPFTVDYSMEFTVHERVS